MLAALQYITWSEQDDRHGNKGADPQDDQQGDGDSLPVPLWGTPTPQVLKDRCRQSAISRGILLPKSGLQQPQSRPLRDLIT